VARACEHQRSGHADSAAGASNDNRGHSSSSKIVVVCELRLHPSVARSD
jgi:hypothetical protein